MIALLFEVVAMLQLESTEKAIRACDKILGLGDIEGSSSEKFQNLIAIILEIKIKLLFRTGNFHQMVRTSRSFKELFDHGDTVATDRQLAKIPYILGLGLMALGQSKNASAVFEEVIERFGTHCTDDLDDLVAWATIDRARILYALGHTDAAYSEYDSVVQRFGTSNVDRVADAVAKAMLLKGHILVEQNRLSAALDWFDNVSACLSSQNLPYSTNLLVVAQYCRGVVLEMLDRVLEAHEAYDAVTADFGTNLSPQIATVVAVAFASQCWSLLRCNPENEGFDMARAVLERYGRSRSNVILTLVGITLVEKARRELELDRCESAIATADTLLSDLTWNPPKNLILARALRAEAFFGLGKEPSCRGELAAMLSLLPECETLPVESLVTLVTFTVRFGPKTVLDLIDGSPAANLLTPFEIALRQELGIETKVAKEVEEVAKDIRLELSKMRKSKNLVPR